MATLYILLAFARPAGPDVLPSTVFSDCVCSSREVRAKLSLYQTRRPADCLSAQPLMRLSSTVRQLQSDCMQRASRKGIF
jgi:hypothetical protein